MLKETIVAIDAIDAFDSVVFLNKNPRAEN